MGAATNQLIADLKESKYSANQQNIVVPVDDFIAALNELALGGGAGLNQLTGDVTAGPGNGSQVATIANGHVTYAKIQNVATVSLLGNATGAPAAPEEITLGANLTFTGTVLNTSGATGSFTTVDGKTVTVTNGIITAIV